MPRTLTTICAHLFLWNGCVIPHLYRLPKDPGTVQRTALESSSYSVHADRGCLPLNHGFWAIRKRTRYICQEVAFDYFPDEGYGEYEISLRVLRFPIGGTYENIITNLLENEFRAEAIKEIYHLRWH